MVACIGLFNSYIVINIGIQAFVATFGVSTLMVGICKISYRRRTIFTLPAGLQGFLSWDKGFVLGTHPGFSYIVSFMHNHSLCIYGKRLKPAVTSYAVGANPAELACGN